MKKLLIILLILIILAIGAAAIGFTYYNDQLGPAEPGNTDPVVVEIPEGSGGYDIVSILYANGLIKSDTVAKIHLKITEYNSLQANTYILNKSLSVPEIFKIINTGDFNYISKVKFTVIEGARLTEVAEKMSEALGIPKKDFIKRWKDKTYLNQLIDKYWFLTDEIFNEGIKYPLEGYLYPETYYVTGEPTIENVTEICLDMMNKKLLERKDQIEASGYSIHDFLSLASVVQSESQKVSDSPVIAGVLINRINLGMKLQCDATVLYALGERHIDVTYSDLEVDSGYNTYKYEGIPIGPISTVPDYTMDALINYDNNDYLYFFACQDGTVLYAKTAEEHNKNVKENLWY